MTDARSELLARVRSTATVAAIPRDYRREGVLEDEERVVLFCERVGEYRTDVRRIAERDVAAVVAARCGTRRLVVPEGVPLAWRPEGIELAEDRALTPRELDEVGGSLTGCSAAIAETGTIVLTAARHEGRRALTLVPDLHICVVRESQIVKLVPEALALLGREGLIRRPLTFISGPSATSDIELSRVEGVHGPRKLVVLVVKENL